LQIYHPEYIPSSHCETCVPDTSFVVLFSLHSSFCYTQLQVKHLNNSKKLSKQSEQSAPTLMKPAYSAHKWTYGRSDDCFDQENHGRSFIHHPASRLLRRRHVLKQNWHKHPAAPCKQPCTCSLMWPACPESQQTFCSSDMAAPRFPADDLKAFC
jgi:hypothetical protein